MDPAEARRTLWARYDAGEISADDVEARLLLLDRAPDGDEAAVRAAVDGPIPFRRRRGGRPALVVALAVVLALALAGGVLAAGDDGDGAPTATSTNARDAPLSGVVGPTVVPGVGVPDAECEQGEALGGVGEGATNAALLSDPPFLPEGYELDDDDTILPGTDADIAMSVAVGDPLPEEIRARVLEGDLPVRMRSWRYADEAAAQSAAAVAVSSACSFAADPFDVPDRPEIGGSVVTGVIPTTAFAGWRLGDRRFLVAVESDGDEPDDLEEARQLAGAIAGAELDAARNPPPPPAP